MVSTNSWYVQQVGVGQAGALPGKYGNIGELAAAPHQEQHAVSAMAAQQVHEQVVHGFDRNQLR
jgi:hypothetical protein